MQQVAGTETKKGTPKRPFVESVGGRPARDQRR
jgi:hypothetical protein